MLKNSKNIITAACLSAVSFGVAAHGQSDFDKGYNSITAPELVEHIKFISSDELEGRLPTGKGEKILLDYLTKEFKNLGYKPGNGDSFLQPVKLVEITAQPEMSLKIGNKEYAYKKDMVMGTSRVSTKESIKNSELVFVGYGVVAPEYNWNDYKDIDVKGKTVVILVNDPGYATKDKALFTGEAMTYYGRWNYKYEEASRQGAAGAIIIHETAPASYGWNVVENSWSGPQYGLETPNNNMDRVAVEGWVKRAVAEEIISSAGFNLNELKDKAKMGSFSQALGVTASVTVNSKIKHSTSNNFIATLPGSEKPDEHLIYTAHWDHIGKDDSKKGDQIYNGAHDNATGTGGLIEIAQAFTKLEKNPKRSVTFLAVTAEEQGLLGSKYYASNPVIPLNKTVANINMDSLNILGKTKDISVTGLGQSDMDDLLAKAAKKQGKQLSQGRNPSAGYYYRSDHFNFAKVGVPALYAGGGHEPINDEVAQYRKKMGLIIKGCYHQVCDHYRKSWDLSGAIQDLKLLYDVGYQISDHNIWPQWSKTSEFSRKK